MLQLPSGSLSLDRVRIMGILNTTPDSFYDGGLYRSQDEARRRVTVMVEEGADLIDVGGEKAGPGEPVGVQEEIDRVCPVIEYVRHQLGVPVSVDTFKPEVARAAMNSGADVINSIGGFRDDAMRAVAIETGASIVIMHIKGEPRVANPNPHYDDVMDEIRTFLLERVEECRAAGIPDDRITIDPGPGFGKTFRHDLAAVRDIEHLTALPYPVLLAVSRKRFIGEVLGMEPADRLEGSLAVTAYAVARGVRLVRTHDVRATRQVCDMVEAILDPYQVRIRV